MFCLIVHISNFAWCILEVSSVELETPNYSQIVELQTHGLWFLLSEPCACIFSIGVLNICLNI